MNARGQYGSKQRAVIGAQILQTLELRQLYENVATDGVRAILNDLSRLGTVTATSSSSWQADVSHEWIRLSWDAPARSLVVSISDKRPRPLNQLAGVQRRYEEFLAQRITPSLTRFRAIAIGGVVGTWPAIPNTMTGITLYHSVGDRADAVKQLTIDWDALYQALASEVGEIPAAPSQIDWSKRPAAVQKAREDELAAYKAVDAAPAAEKSAAVKRAHAATQRRGELYLASFDPKKVAWWNAYAKPLFKAWTQFKRDQLGGDRTFADLYIAFAERWQTNWEVYEDWKKKLDNLRAEATARGFAADTPKPADLPATVWADAGGAVSRGAGAVATGLGDTWTILKYGAWAVLGIGAIVAVSSVVSDLRSGKDPADKYLQLIRDAPARLLRAPRTQRSLPSARAPLALPPSELVGAV